jgi:hypothetical protein
MFVKNRLDMGLFQNISTRPDIHLDIFIQSVKVGSRIRLTPIEGQQVQNYFVECSRKLRAKYPVGTIFKVDCRLVRPSNRKPYLMVLHRNGLEQALEFYDHNRTLTINQVSI